MTSSRRPAASAGGLTTRPEREKGCDKAVSTVPGCKATHSACGWLRANSIEAVRTNWLSAALAAR